MANTHHVELAKQGAKSWNTWRRDHPNEKPDLKGADLSLFSLDGADFSDADLFRSALAFCSLEKANFRRANLIHANLSGANLKFASFEEATLVWANLKGAVLIGANLRLANLGKANFQDALLQETDFAGSILGMSGFGNTDLSTVKGLELVKHHGPSTIGIDTLFRSDQKIPESFLRGAGVPEDFITFIPSLIGRAIEFYSCFISHSHLDEDFSGYLHNRMRRENLRVWFAPEDMPGGRKLHEEIYQAIQVHDKLLLVLSANSMKSEWVMTEVRRAKKVEREENRRKLFPIRLVDFPTIQKWECFDADSGKDLAVEVREYYIPDFSNWKNHDSFESEFAKLLRDLRATAH